MHLKRLKIQTLPGIEPGFTFEPPGAGTNIVTGPNAIGKSSLERALGYLLRNARKEDPIALSLEAELVSSNTTWRVQRNGSQVVWYRDGKPASPPALPSAGQAGLYRLSVEHLLADDDHDRDLAHELRKSLRGGFDLDEPRLNPGARFARAEATNLANARQNLRQAEAEYDALERQEREELPRLDRDIKAAEEAQSRLGRLQQGLDLHHAIEKRNACAEALKVYPPGMEKLRGDEQDRLAKLEKKSEDLQGRLREQERKLHDAEAALEDTGLQQSGPDPERLDITDRRLQQLGQKIERRRNVREALDETAAGLKKAQAPFKGGGAQPKLDAQSLEKAEAVAVPLVKAQNKRNELQLKLDQAGNPPDEAEINKLYEAGSALREWLRATADESGPQPASRDRRLRFVLWSVIAAAGLAAVLAGIQQALPAMAAVLVALGAAVWGLFVMRRRRPAAGSPADAAKKRFARTALDEPPDWTVAAVEEYLRSEIDRRYSALVLQKEWAAQLAGIRPELEKVEAEISEFQARRQEVAAEVGFDPELPSLSPDLFMEHCRQLVEAESRYEQAKAGLQKAERDIAEDAGQIREFLAPWRSDVVPAPEDAEDDQHVNRLQVAFQDLKRRSDDAKEARKDITNYRDSIRSIKEQIKENREEIEQFFAGCGLDADARTELDRRQGLLGDWREKHSDLERTKIEEERIRTLLGESPEIIKDIEEGGRVANLQRDLSVAEEQAGRHTDLIKQEAELKSRLDQAGADHKLSQARAAEDIARAALHDKREQAWLYESTELLLDDVEQVFRSKKEPEVLSEARTRFRKITANAFDLQLGKDGAFVVRDLQQEVSRDIGELSSGTRMQLLLALRLAWIEAQEQGGESLPLFLDEALTTSDEDRFAVMAKSLEQLARNGGRQIFYLSARRHECALWKQSTGNEPPVIDLAETRFPREAHPPQDYDIVLPPSLPSPEGRDPETYASVLGVPLVNPRLDPGAIHLFYLLRDNLDLLYELIKEWRITSLGQLETLLGSNAVSAAVTDTGVRDRLRQRCGVVHIWTKLWRQGRGRPVDRIALEQSGAVSETFIDRVADLSEEIKGDGAVLVQALRDGRAPRFQSGKIEELERWLADEGYTDEEEILPAEERRRLALQQAMSNADADIEDLNRVITWLESATP